MNRFIGRSLGLMLIGVLASCGSSGSGEDAGGDVAITLKDFSLIAEPGTFAAGDLTFGIRNDGPSAHEFMIIRSDARPGELPMDGGRIPEDQVDRVDETEDIAPGTNASLSVRLAPGQYIFVCNVSAHYEAGMYAGFTVL